MLTVQSLMTKLVVTATLDTPLLRVHEIMEERQIRHLPVVEDGELIGIVSDLDVARSMSPKMGTLGEKNEDREALRTLAHRFMTRNPITVTPDTPIYDAAEILLSKQVSCLPVLDSAKHLVGIITVTDFLRLLSRKDLVLTETSHQP